MLRAGSSTELCGGTHVKATGDIGTIKVVSEGSIGSNLRRIEAVTGQQTISYMQRTDVMVNKVSERVGGRPDDILAGVERRLDEMKLLQDEMKFLRSQINATRAADLIQQAVDGVVVGRVDGLSATDLRELGVAIRQHPQVLVAVLGGITDTGGVSLVAAITSEVKITAQEIIKDAAKKLVGVVVAKETLRLRAAKTSKRLTKHSRSHDNMQCQRLAVTRSDACLGARSRN